LRRRPPTLADRRHAGTVPPAARGRDQSPRGAPWRPAYRDVTDRVPQVQAGSLDSGVALSDNNTGCPVCGFAQRVRVGEWNQLTIVACPQCGQRYVWPVPSEAVLNAIYDQNYYGGGQGSLGFSAYAG